YYNALTFRNQRRLHPQNMTVAPLAVNFPRPVITSATQTDDLQLAAGCADGDSDSFAEVYRRFGERMKSIAFNHLGNIADAEDAVQDTFVSCIARRAASPARRPSPPGSTAFWSTPAWT